MVTNLRRLFWLALFGGAGYAGFQAWRHQRDADTPAAPAPEWPPIDPPADPEPALAAAGFAGTSGGSSQTKPQLWVEPVDGECPEGYPIKANDNSGIFHVPGGRFYNRTVPERCYANADDAVDDGYRAAKA